jgi:hypothetical protein
MGEASARRYFGDDGQIHTMAARVEAWDGEPSHFEVNEEGDVIIHCKLHRGGTPVKANLGPLCAARGAGVWLIPDAGTEVLLGSDHGDFEGELYLLAMHPTGQNPGGLAPGKVLVIGDAVEVRSFAGKAQGVVVEAHRTAEDKRIGAEGTYDAAIATFIAAQTVYNAAIATQLPALAVGGLTSPAGLIAAAGAAFVAEAVAIEEAISEFEAGAETYLARILKAE